MHFRDCFRMWNYCRSWGISLHKVPWLVLLVSLSLNVIFLGDVAFHSSRNESDWLVEQATATTTTTTTTTEPHKNIVTSTRHVHKNYYNESEYKCKLINTIKPVVYVYDIPSSLREDLRKQWFEQWYQEKYTPEALNFGFGERMDFDLVPKRLDPFRRDNKRHQKNMDIYYEDYYFTHMHSMEIFVNERLKVEEKALAQSQSDRGHPYVHPKWVTNDPSQASVFVIPFPFALNFRALHEKEWPLLQGYHGALQQWLDVC
ncbi:hypothetical protein RFI_09852, partial [Reticulomyxa filosa]